MVRAIFCYLVCASSLTTSAIADVTTTFDYIHWQSMVGDYATIDFTGFANGTPISTQFATVGLTFTGPSFIAAGTSFVNDGWGLHGPSGLHVSFDEPQSWIAIHHAANAYFDLYFQGKLIGASGFDSIGGIDSFLGVLSTMPFDEVVITKPSSFGTHIFVDDLHFGPAIPAPGALALAAIAGACTPRRRRRM